MNSRVLNIAPSVTLGITSKAKALKAAGEDVVSFAAGEPDFDTPEHIKQAAADALMAGQTKYAPVPGLPALREAIAAKLLAENGLKYGVDQVIVNVGAKHTLFNVMMALLDEGDEVIIPSPYWLSYPEMVSVAGGVPVFVAGDMANDYKVTPDQLKAAITEHTRALILNSPSNPIGIVYSREELAALARVAVEADLTIVSDEIYEKLVYDGVTHSSVGSLSDDFFARTITVNGFSKCYSMTGWRLGYAAGPLGVIKAMNALQSHSTSGACTFAQYGGLAALQGDQSCVAEMVKAFSKRRTYMFERLSKIEGVECVCPQGAFYMLPDISAFGLGSVEFCEKLLEESKVAAVPGEAFGADGNIRLSYACSMDVIEEGLNRIEAFVDGLM